MRVEVARPRRPMLALAVAVTLGLVVFVAVSSIAAGIFMVSPANGNASGILTTQPGSIPWDGHRPLTVLFIGRNSKGQATSFRVASLQPQKPHLGLLELPANLWVTIPGFGQATLSSAYADGGPQMARVTVESVLGSFIPYYAVVDPSVGISAFSQVGSIPGHDRHNLSGIAALRGFARSTYSAQNRTLRRILASTSTTFPLAALPGFLNAAGAGLRTNIPYSQAAAIMQLVESLPARSIISVAAEESPIVAPYHGYLLPDFSRLHVLAGQVLQPYRIQGGVRVLNGSGVTGRAASLSTWLQSLGIHVSGYANAATADLSHTHVVVGKNAGPREQSTGRSLAILLNVPFNIRNGSSSAPTIYIGQDFQDPAQQ